MSETMSALFANLVEAIKALIEVISNFIAGFSKTYAFETAES